MYLILSPLGFELKIDKRIVSEEQKRNFAEKPEEYLAYRKAVEREMNSDFAIV